MATPTQLRREWRERFSEAIQRITCGPPSVRLIAYPSGQPDLLVHASRIMHPIAILALLEIGAPDGFEYDLLDETVPTNQARKK